MIKKCNCLKMTSQGQHFFHSYFKTLSVGRAGVRASDPVLVGSS